MCWQNTWLNISAVWWNGLEKLNATSSCVNFISNVLASFLEEGRANMATFAPKLLNQYVSVISGRKLKMITAQLMRIMFGDLEYRGNNRNRTFQIWHCRSRFVADMSPYRFYVFFNGLIRFVAIPVLWSFLGREKRRYSLYRDPCTIPNSRSIFRKSFGSLHHLRDPEHPCRKLSSTQFFVTCRKL